MSKWVFYGVIAVVLAFIALYSYERITHNKDNSANEKEKTALRLEIKNLEESKTRVIRDTIEVEVPYYVTKTEYLPSDSFLVYRDTSYYYVREYKDTLVTDDFLIPYRLTVNGYLEQTWFGNYTILREQTTIEHIVREPYEVVREIEKGHLYLYGMAGTTGSFDEQFSWEGGIDFTYKKIGFLMGYQRYDGINLFKLGLKVRLL